MHNSVMGDFYLGKILILKKSPIYNDDLLTQKIMQSPPQQLPVLGLGGSIIVPFGNTDSSFR